MEFVPYHLANASKAIVVDGQLADAFPLSHWRGSNIHSHLADDTSAAIVLNAIQQQISQLDLPQVTANHYDIDGLVGVWSLLHQEEAVKLDELLRHIALIADFREYEPNNPFSDQALKIVLTLNRIEKEKFYPPFGQKQEAESCVLKFKFFIPLFSEILFNIHAFEDIWKNDFEEIIAGVNITKKVTVNHVQNIRLTILELPKPLPYYSFTWSAQNSDMILTVYPENTYELAYRYTTWVDAAKRKVFPRMHLEPLIEQLNKEEASNHSWNGEDILDTGPILRLGNDTLTRSERFDDPNRRNIQPSSIRPERFTQHIVDYFTNCYQYLTPRRYTDWKEIKELANLYSYGKNN